MKIIFGLVLVALMVPTGAFALLIDDFNMNQNFSVTAGNTVSNNVSIPGDPYVVGGERDVEATAVGGTTLSVTSDLGGTGQFYVSAPFFQTWTTVLQWDGGDNSSALNHTGLGGLDFTDSGVNHLFNMILATDHAGLNIELNVYTDASNWSSFSSGDLPVITPPDNYLVLFSNFTTQAGTGADFANVGAIQLTLSTDTEALDVLVDIFETSNIPEPATMILFGTGLSSLALFGRRKKIKKA